MSYEEVVSYYGDKLVLVASLEERWQALASHLPISYLNQLTPTHYCILELVGKGRENVGNSLVRRCFTHPTSAVAETTDDVSLYGRSLRLSCRGRVGVAPASSVTSAYTNHYRFITM
ncbi:unnamed protein product, partial [Brenthis ino]